MNDSEDSSSDPVGDELRSISTIRDVLMGLKDDQRMRVLYYVNSAFGVTPVSSQTSPEHTIAPLRDYYDSRRGYAAKRPTSDIERVLVLAHALRMKGETRFDSGQLSEERLAAAAPPFNVIEAAKSAVKKGYFAAAGEGKRQLTVLGEEVADALPDREAVLALLHESGKRASTRRKR